MVTSLLSIHMCVCSTWAIFLSPSMVPMVHLSSLFIYLEPLGWSYWPNGARMLSREISFWKYRSFLKSIQWPVKLSTTLKQLWGIISVLIKSEKSMSGGWLKREFGQGREFYNSLLIFPFSTDVLGDETWWSVTWGFSRQGTIIFWNPLVHATML